LIRILVVDDHPAVRAGLLAVLRGEPGLVPVGAVSTRHMAVEEVERTECTLALVDLHIGEENGLELCRELKRLERPPRVVIYSSFVTRQLVLPARLAGADGLVDKGTPTPELFAFIRSAARGELAMQPATPDVMAATATMLDTEDLPILGMVMDGTPHGDIATVLGLSEQEVDDRLSVMLARLTAPPARSSSIRHEIGKVGRQPPDDGLQP
jgi:DNA-binding NarL/FixJ family response regulator